MGGLTLICAFLLAALLLPRRSHCQNCRSSGSFGENCTLKCQYAKYSNCDAFTGDCAPGDHCTIRYFGPFFQYVRLQWSTWRVNTYYSFSNEVQYVVSPVTVDVSCIRVFGFIIRNMLIEGRTAETDCTSETSGGSNIALKQLANQSSTYWRQGEASNAVDGNTERNFQRSSRAPTNSGLKPLWATYFYLPPMLLRAVLTNSDNWYRDEYGLHCGEQWCCFGSEICSQYSGVSTQTFPQGRFVKGCSRQCDRVSLGHVWEKRSRFSLEIYFHNTGRPCTGDNCLRGNLVYLVSVYLWSWTVRCVCLIVSICMTNVRHHRRQHRRLHHHHRRRRRRRRRRHRRRRRDRQRRHRRLSRHLSRCLSRRRLSRLSLSRSRRRLDSCCLRHRRRIRTRRLIRRRRCLRYRRLNPRLRRSRLSRRRSVSRRRRLSY